ncbi:unnamed protein product, partial [Ectocarpus sp. 8 AP-2014]
MRSSSMYGTEGRSRKKMPPSRWSTRNSDRPKCNNCKKHFLGGVSFLSLRRSLTYSCVRKTTLRNKSFRADLQQPAQGRHPNARPHARVRNALDHPPPQTRITLLYTH